ncbi:hypothetical protein HER18_05295 [Chryseobacterium sp. NEB161]|nr:hypothetical protein HER18_05295 [Chryseobacterium sp. NEB161]
MIKKKPGAPGVKKTSTIRHPSSIFHPPSSIFQHPSPIFHLPSPDIHPSSITPHPTSIINSSTPKIFLPLAERSAFALINLSLIKKILALLALKKTSIIHHPTSILHPPSSIFHHPSSNIHHQFIHPENIPALS